MKKVIALSILIAVVVTGIVLGISDAVKKKRLEQSIIDSIKEAQEANKRQRELDNKREQITEATSAYENLVDIYLKYRREGDKFKEALYADKNDLDDFNSALETIGNIFGDSIIEEVDTVSSFRESLEEIYRLIKREEFSLELEIVEDNMRKALNSQ